MRRLLLDYYIQLDLSQPNQGNAGIMGSRTSCIFCQFCFSFMLHICALFQVHLQFNPPFFFTVAPLRNRIGRTHQFEQPRSSESGSLKNMTRRMCFIVCVPLQRHSPGRAYPIHPLLSPPPSLLFFLLPPPFLSSKVLPQFSSAAAAARFNSADAAEDVAWRLFVEGSFACVPNALRRFRFLNCCRYCSLLASRSNCLVVDPTEVRAPLR